MFFILKDLMLKPVLVGGSGKLFNVFLDVQEICVPLNKSLILPVLHLI